jgi:adenosylcobinamide-GDP ribazoletransferase
VTVALRQAANGAVLAITFLTILPLPARDDRDDGGSAPAFHPLVGALVGAVAGAVYAAAAPGLGSSVAAVLAVAALVVVTGGLHQDGLADCADGLGVRGDRERRLLVMRDPAIGTFGTLALVLWVLLLTTALAQLSTRDGVAALITAAATARFAALLHARRARPARTDGLGSAFVPSWISVVIGGLTAVVVAVACDVTAAPFAVLASLLVAAGVTAWSRRTLGGRTGDTLGATVVLTEVTVVLMWRVLVPG